MGCMGTGEVPGPFPSTPLKASSQQEEEKENYFLWGTRKAASGSPYFTLLQAYGQNAPAVRNLQLTD